MTEIEDLIRQAQETLKKWRKPIYEDSKPPRAKSWQEIMDNRGYDPNQVSYLASRSRGI